MVSAALGEVRLLQGPSDHTACCCCFETQQVEHNSIMRRVFVQFSGDFGCMVTIQWMLRHGRMIAPCRLLLAALQLYIWSCHGLPWPATSCRVSIFAACISLTIVLFCVDVGWQQQEGPLGVACLRTVLQRYVLLQCMLWKELLRGPLVDCLVLFMPALEDICTPRWWSLGSAPNDVALRWLGQTVVSAFFSQIYLWQFT